MNTERTFKIRLVKKEVWSVLNRTHFNPLLFKTRRTALSIIRTMHNRHIGITPQLSAQLARLVTEPSTAFQIDAPWPDILNRLSEELETVSQYSNAPNYKGFGLVLNAAPPYSVIRLAMPIIEEACKRIGLCCLFCEDDTGSVPAEGYKRYSQMLNSELSKIAKEKNDFFQIFWKERALTLTNYSRRHSLWGDISSSLPETTPSAAGLMLRMKPKVPPLKTASRSPKQSFSRLKHRESSKYKEGGFSGIRISARPEDMEDILMSEFLNPPILLADRLINSGYLALKRKPKHEKLRDVLIVGLMPHQVRPQLNTDFIKACWFDFISRLGLMLCRHKLMNSLFQWLEGDTLGRCRTSKFHLKDLPMPEVPSEQDPTPAFRQGFLAALGWIPSFLDTRAEYDTIPHRSTGTTDGDSTPAIQWASSAWKEQVLQDKKRKTNDLDTFAFVHLMVFLPAKPSETEILPPNTHLAQMHRSFDFPRLPGRTISITHVPQTINDTGNWAVDRPKHADSRLFPGQENSVPWEDIAGRMEQVWLEHLVEEIWNG